MLGQIGVTIIGLLCLSAAANLVSGCSVGDKITFVEREGWSGRSPDGNIPLDNPVSRVYVFHTGGKGCIDNNCASEVRAVQAFHMDDNNWSDIPYNFVIGTDLKVFEGPGWTTTSYKTPNPPPLIYIGFYGTYKDFPPPDAMFTTLRKLLRVGRAFGHLTSDVELCCGSNSPAALCDAIIKYMPEYNC